MRSPLGSHRPTPAPPLPHDVKSAVAFLRAAVDQPVSLADLVRHCGVPERTLNTHFRAFLKMSPMRYLRRLRLEAARETLRAREPGISVSRVARQYGFNHFGRFADQYRRQFGETPSATLRRASPAAGLSTHRDVNRLVMCALPLVFASHPDATRRALDLLHRAIDIEPTSGVPTALAAWCHAQLVMYNATRLPTADTRQAFYLLRRAEQLDEDNALSLTARCAVHTMAKEFDIAEILVTRALRLNPSFGWAWGRSGWLHSYRGDSETAIEHFGRALSLNPNATARANIFGGIGSAHFSAGRYEAAVFWLRRALCEQPTPAWFNRTLSVSYARLGEKTKALRSVAELRRFSPDVTVGRIVAAVPFSADYMNRLGDGLIALGLPP